MSAPPSGDLANKTIRGVFWSYGAFALGKTVVLVSTAILARLLVPAEFGIVAVATVVISFLAVLQGLGLGAALIQRRGNIEHAANVVFTLNLLLGISLTVGLFLAAPWIADYFREPGATPLLRALGLTFTLEALGTVHLVRLQRDLRFNRAFIPDVGQSMVKSIVSIALAVAGMGAWSLVAGQLVGISAGVLLSWAVFRWRPRLEIDIGLARSLISFGLPLFGVEIMWVLSVNLDYLIVGRQLGSESLGIYTLAYRLPELLVVGLMIGVNRVVFPALSFVQDDLENLRRGFLATTHYVVLVAFPLSVGIAIVAGPIIRVALGPGWDEAIPVVRVLAIAVLIASMMDVDGDVYKAVGRPGILFKLSLIHVAILIPALLIGVHYGLVGVALGHVFTTTIMRAGRTVVVSRFLDIPLTVIAAQWRTAILGSLVLGLMAGTTLHLTAGTSLIVSLVASVLAGAIGYLAVVAALEGTHIIALIRSALGRQDVTLDET